MKRRALPATTSALLALALALGLVQTLVWSEEPLDKFAFLPIIAKEPFTPTPTPSRTPTPTGFVGWHSIKGHVYGAATTTPVPLGGAVVSYTRFSFVLPYTYGMTLTLEDGGYAFAPIPLRDTDFVRVYAQADGYAPQQAQRRGVEILFNSTFDFVLDAWTPTPNPTE